MSYGNVYVAQVAMGANHNQPVKALKEAYDGPSLRCHAACNCTWRGCTTSVAMKRAVKAATGR